MSLIHQICFICRIAYDRGTGRPVGAAVNNSCLKEELGLSLEQELAEVEALQRRLEVLQVDADPLAAQPSPASTILES